MRRLRSAPAHGEAGLLSTNRSIWTMTTETGVQAASRSAAVVPQLVPGALLAMQSTVGNAAVANAVQRLKPHKDLARISSLTMQRKPEVPASETSPADEARPLDPLADGATMESVAREGANRLAALLTPYRVGCMSFGGPITLSELLASGTMPEFSEEYEATIATIRTQALAALHQAKGFLEKLDPALMNRFGAAALQGVDVAIAAISDGNDIVFIVDSRTGEGQGAVASIKHFADQIAIRNRGFRDESGQSVRVSAGISVHSDPTDPGRPESAKADDRSISILDIGALYDNRALEGEGLVGPIQDPPGTLQMRMDSASAVDLRAVFIHEVGGHASASPLPALSERLAAGQKLTDAQLKSQEAYNEMLVDNIVDRVAFFSFVRDDLSRSLITKLGRD